MTTVNEIAPDVYRISTFVPDAGIQFSQFLVVDEEPLLFETGFKAMFPLVREAVAQIIDPSTIRWISFSHFEGDECGSLNEWLDIAPDSQALCSFVGSITSVQDFAIRAPRAMQHDEVLPIGKKRIRFRQTPHVPHCWDAGLMFEETERVLFSSDLFFQNGDLQALTRSDVVEPSIKALTDLRAGPLAVPIPYTLDTERIINGLADLEPRVLAAHHGSCFEGDGGKALRDLASAVKDFGHLIEDGDPFAQPGPTEGAPDALDRDEPIEDEVAKA
jgi:flavorubredoxin